MVAGSRLRKSCYFDSTVRGGVTGFTSYNHMLLPIAYKTAAKEYANLCENVNIWDVAVERQIEIKGPDALILADMLTPRAMKSMKVGEARYAILTDEEGMVLNDPVVLRIAEDRFWYSIADSDVALWMKGFVAGLARSKKLDVQVFEAAVSPCALQGPKSLDLVKDLFGEWVGELKYFNFRETSLDGIPLVLCRSGWSPERGYELFLQDETRGDELWQRLTKAGEQYSILPGVPHQVRRMEGGMLSYGSDITAKHNVLELSLPSTWIKLDKENEFLGQGAVEALLKSGGPKRRVTGIKVVDRALVPTALIKSWDVLSEDGKVIGTLSSFCFSSSLGSYIGIATLQSDFAKPDTSVRINTPDGQRMAVVHKLPFMPRVN